MIITNRREKQDKLSEIIRIRGIINSSSSQSFRIIKFTETHSFLPYLEWAFLFSGTDRNIKGKNHQRRNFSLEQLETNPTQYFTRNSSSFEPAVEMEFKNKQCRNFGRIVKYHQNSFKTKQDVVIAKYCLPKIKK